MARKKATEAGSEGVPATSKKTRCPVTAAQFIDLAESLELEVDKAHTLILEPKVFGTGSFGWGTNEKVTLRLSDGTPVKVQASLNLVVVGSKDAEGGESAESDE